MSYSPTRRSLLKGLLAIPVVAAIPKVADSRTLVVDLAGEGEWTNIVTLGTIEPDADVYYQGSGCVSRKISEPYYSVIDCEGRPIEEVYEDMKNQLRRNCAEELATQIFNEIPWHE